ncbi:MAG: PilZ domain-containing protein, partial [Candidatus Omnitrophota bacterium]
QFRRISAKFPIRYRIRRGGFFASALTENLSLSGTRLNADRFFPQGLNLNLELNILSKIINPVGKVVWSQPLPHSNRYKMGIQFIEINPQDKNYLTDYVNMRIPELSQSQT